MRQQYHVRASVLDDASKPYSFKFDMTIADGETPEPIAQNVIGMSGFKKILSLDLRKVRNEHD